MNVNRVFLAGHLTRDPEPRYLPSGTAVASFGMAINRKWKGEGGEDKDEVCYVEIVFFGKRAEVISEYFKKGSPIFVEGRLKFEQWESKDGQKRSTLKVVADNFQFVGGGKGGNSRVQQETAGAAIGDSDINEEEIPF